MIMYIYINMKSLKEIKRYYDKTKYSFRHRMIALTLLIGWVIYIISVDGQIFTQSR